MLLFSYDFIKIGGMAKRHRAIRFKPTRGAWGFLASIPCRASRSYMRCNILRLTKLDIVLILKNRH